MGWEGYYYRGSSSVRRGGENTNVCSAPRKKGFRRCRQSIWRPRSVAGRSDQRLDGSLAVAPRRVRRRDGWCSWGTKSLAEWVAWRCGLEPRAAREHVRVARALRELPLTAARLESGELSFSKARALTRVATPESEALLEMARRTQRRRGSGRILGVYRTVSREEAEDVNESAFVSDLGTRRLAADRGRLGPGEGSAFLPGARRGQDALEWARGAGDAGAVPDSKKYENGSAEPQLEPEQARARPSGADALGFMSNPFWLADRRRVPAANATVMVHIRPTAAPTPRTGSRSRRRAPSASRATQLSSRSARTGTASP